MSNRRYIQHLRSKDVETIQQYGLNKDIPKVPETDNLKEGEIAINYAKDNEIISIKNDNNEIVKFLNEKVIYENEEITAAAMSQLKNEIANEINNINETIENFEPGDAGVQSDWNETDEESLAYIKNKPTIPTKTSELTNDAEFVTSKEYVQSDWDETDTRSMAYIDNKPTSLSDFTNDTMFITINDVPEEVMLIQITSLFGNLADEHGETISANKTFAEIRAAYNSGLEIIAKNDIGERGETGYIRTGDSGYLFRLQFLTSVGAQFVATRNEQTTADPDDKSIISIFAVSSSNEWVHKTVSYDHTPDLKTIGEISLFKTTSTGGNNITMDELIAGGVVVESTSGSGQYDSIQLKDRLGNNIGSPINCSQFLTGGLLKSITVDVYPADPKSATPISSQAYSHLSAEEQEEYLPYEYVNINDNSDIITWQEYDELSATDQLNYTAHTYNVKEKYMVIEFEDDNHNIKKTMIPLNDIFNSSNYYTKDEVDNNIMKSEPLYIYCEPISAISNHLEITSTSNNEYTTFDVTFFNIIKNMVRDDTREVIFVEKGYALDPITDPTTDIYYYVSDIYITPQANEYSSIIARNISSGVDGAVSCKTLTYTDEYPNDVILGNASVRPTLVATVSEVHHVLTIDKTFSQLYYAISVYDQCVNLKYGNSVLCPSAFYFGTDDTPAEKKYVKFTSVTKDENNVDVIMDIIVNGLQEVKIDTRTFNEELDGYKIVECSAMDVTFADDFLSRCNYNYANGATASSVQGLTYDVLVSITKEK